jgi:uncharacterized protein YjbI with pentapeptide repeats
MAPPTSVDELVTRHTAGERDFAGLELPGADLAGVNLSKSRLFGAKLARANLARANLMGADLSGADLRQADLSGVNGYGTVLDGANLSRGSIEGSLFREASLRRTDLSQLTSEHVQLVQCDLSEARLMETSFSFADFSGSDISGADLREAGLGQCLLQNVSLNGANLTAARLEEAVFHLVDVDGAIFSGASFGRTVLADLDLRPAVGLDSAVHRSPSTIDSRCLTRSHGQISEAFLRGCGLQDWEVLAARLYNPGLTAADINNLQYAIYDARVGRPILVSPLFISYSTRDRLFVDALERHLDERGIRCWRDTHDIVAGRIEAQIDGVLTLGPVLLLVLSQNSVASDWVLHEVRKAREAERKFGRDLICPIALDGAWQDCRWPARLMEQVKEYNVLDFSRWNDDAFFDEQFKKLIRGLSLFYPGPEA